MARSSFAILVSFLLTGCDAGGLLIVQDGGGIAVEASTACEPTPDNFCDDCNPCTVKANCTPCDGMLNPTIYNCGGYLGGAGDPLSPVCYDGNGAYLGGGCRTQAITTPPGQANACFPVAGVMPLESGVCRSGDCVP